MRIYPVFFGILFASLILLSSCGGANDVSTLGVSHSAAEHHATLSLEEVDSSNTANGTLVRIVVSNLRQDPIHSVRSWIRFDPTVTEVSDLAVNADTFVLFAPGEREIDFSNGMVKIGGATVQSVTDSEIIVATMRVRSLQEDTPSILSFHDWKPGGDGHTAVLSVQNGSAINIVQPPSSLELQ